MRPVRPELRDACARRRAKFAARLGGATAVIPAGQAPARNYPDNPYNFRASSHFLYLVGVPMEGAVLVVSANAATLFTHAPSAADALWHGPQPSLSELSGLLGVFVAPIEDLPDAIAGRTLGALPPADAASIKALDALGPRTADGTVAEAIIAGRLVHDDAAIAQLRLAAEATTAAHIAGMGATCPGLHEWAIAGVITGALARLGMTTSYPPIVSVHGEVLHNHAHHHPMAAGDLLLADVGAETAEGWAGDVTRTWPVSGRFSKTQRAIYEVVLAAHSAALANTKPGVRYRDVHLAGATALTQGLVDLGVLRGSVEALVADDVHALFFPHGIGHLIGLDVHDMEDLGDRASYAPGRARSHRFGLGYLRLDRDLAAGMAVTIEPGFYQVPAILEDPERRAAVGDRVNWSRLADFSDVRGIRIEDDILLTKDSYVNLTLRIPRTVAEIEALVGQNLG